MSSPYGGNDPNASYPGGPAGGSPAPTYGSPDAAPGGGGFSGTGPGGPGGPGGGGPGGYGTGGAPGPGIPPTPPKKSNTTRNIILGCAAALLALLLLGGCGALGVMLLGKGSDKPTAEPVSQTSTEDATPSDSASPTTDDSPSDSPSSADPSGDPSITLDTGDTGEMPEVETDSGKHTPTNGVFVWVDITLTNNGDTAIGFSPDAFTVVDTTGTEHPVAVGTSDASSTTLEPGQSASARLYIDVAPGTKADTVKYLDPGV